MSRAIIIIVNWNTGKLLAGCLQSLLALPEQNRIGQIIVVDNASTDNSMEQAQEVATGHPNISLVRSGENLGFAAATNIGIRRLGEQSADHILLLNPDTEMQPGSLEALLQTLDRHPKVGIVGPMLLSADGNRQDSVRRFPSFFVLAGMFLKLNRLLPNDRLWRKYLAADFNYEKEQEAEQVMGACFLIRRQTLQEVGLLDEGFWVWFEEVDFCRRALSAGWKTLYTPTARVLHYGGASFHQLVGWRKSSPYIRSALRYAKKHFSFLSSAALYILAPIAVLLVLPASVVHYSHQTANKARL